MFVCLLSVQASRLCTLTLYICHFLPILRPCLPLLTAAAWLSASACVPGTVVAGQLWDSWRSKSAPLHALLPLPAALPGAEAGARQRRLLWQANPLCLHGAAHAPPGHKVRETGTWESHIPIAVLLKQLYCSELSSPVCNGFILAWEGRLKFLAHGGYKCVILEQTSLYTEYIDAYKIIHDQCTVYIYSWKMYTI